MFLRGKAELGAPALTWIQSR